MTPTQQAYALLWLSPKADVLTKAARDILRDTLSLEERQQAVFADDKHMPTLIEKGMIEIDGEDYITTSKGWLFLDSRKSTSGADSD